MYIKVNSIRLLMGLAQIDDPPVISGPTLLTAPNIVSITTGSTADVSYTNTDDWAAAGGGLAIFCSRPVGTSISSFSGPFRYTDKVLGAGTPPVSPKTITLPFNIPDGTKLYCRFVASAPDGRVSNDVIDFLLAT